MLGIFKKKVFWEEVYIDSATGAVAVLCDNEFHQKWSLGVRCRQLLMEKGDDVCIPLNGPCGFLYISKHRPRFVLLKHFYVWYSPLL